MNWVCEAPAALLEQSGSKRALALRLLKLIRCTFFKPRAIMRVGKHENDLLRIQRIREQSGVLGIHAQPCVAESASPTQLDLPLQKANVQADYARISLDVFDSKTRALVFGA